MTPFEHTLMHGTDWQPGDDVTGWHVSEKLDGCRLRWDGAYMRSRSGLQVDVPHALVAELPPVSIDFEAWAGRGNFELARRAVQYGEWTPAVRLVALDAPGMVGLGWLARLTVLASYGLEVVPLVPLAHPGRVDTLREQLRALHAAGGEGFMLHKPDAPYIHGRTTALLKFKAHELHTAVAA
jgi:DNA ligase-1